MNSAELQETFQSYVYAEDGNSKRTEIHRFSGFYANIFHKIYLAHTGAPEGMEYWVC